MAALLFLRGIPTRIYEASETRGSPAKHWGGKDCLNGIEFKDSKIFVNMSAGKANKGRSSGAGRTSSGGSSKASSKDAPKQAIQEVVTVEVNIKREVKVSLLVCVCMSTFQWASLAVH